MAAKLGVPLKNRLVAWICSAVVGLSFFYIFDALFAARAETDAAPYWSVAAVVIGVVAGGGCFSLVTVNWFKGGAGDAQAIKTLLNRQVYEQLREASAAWLARMADPTSEHVRAALEKATKDASEMVARAAGEALKELERRRTRRPTGTEELGKLVRALSEADNWSEVFYLDEVKALAVRMTADLGEAKRVLGERLRSDDQTRALRAAECLLDVLTAELQQASGRQGAVDTKRFVREDAALAKEFNAAVQDGDTEFVVVKLRERDPVVRRKAAQVLQMIGTNEPTKAAAALTALRLAIDDESAVVAHAVCRAIREVLGVQRNG